MTTYTLTVATDELGLGVINGGRVVIDRKRAIAADQYPAVDVLYSITTYTDEDGIAEAELKADDSSVYHVARVYDAAGAIAYQQAFAMPPEASSLHDLSAVVIGTSNIQFRVEDEDVGTPGTVRFVNFNGLPLTHTFSGGQLNVNIIGDTIADALFVVAGQSNADGRGYIDATVEKKQPNVIMLDKSETVRVATEPTGDQTNWSVPNNSLGSTSEPGHSFALRMAKEISKATGIKPVVVPCAIGSTSIADWLDFDDDLDRTTLFGAMNYRVASLDGVVRAAPVFCWYGHEGSSELPVDDLDNGIINSDYQEAWDQLMHEVRSRYPTSPILFAQLAGHSDVDIAADHRRAGEAQRQADSIYGDSSTIYGYRDSGYDIDTESFVAKNTDATNTVTLTSTTAAWAGDGSSALGFDVIKLVPDTTYRLTVTVAGTGAWKILASSQVAAGLGTGTVTTTFTTDGTGIVSFYRNASGAASSLTFSAFVLETPITPMIPNSYMVVTHDVTRNAVPDDVHVSAAGQREIGRRFALVYRQCVLGEDINGRGPWPVSVTAPTSTTVSVTFDREIEPDDNDYGDLFEVYDGGEPASIASAVIDPADSNSVLITLDAALTGLACLTYGNPARPDPTVARPGCVYDTDGLPAPMFGPITFRGLMIIEEGVSGGAVTHTRASTGTYLDSSGVMQTAAIDTARIDHDRDGNLLGLLCEGNNTNYCKYSRDLTNALWVKTNATTALTSTGLDGASNSATRLTATAANATALQSITLASGTRSFSVDLRRVTGTGAVEITLDGSAWTPVAIDSDGFSRVHVVGTILNPVIGIRLATSGDAVDVDCAQLEDSAGPTSRIITTSATVQRAADLLSVNTTTIGLSASSGSLVLDAITPAGSELTSRVLYLGDASGSANRLLFYRSASTMIFNTQSGGVQQAQLSVSHSSNSARFRAAMSWQADRFALSVNGAAASVDTAGTVPPVTVFNVGRGNSSTTSEYWAGHVRNLQFFVRALTAPELKNFSGGDL